MTSTPTMKADLRGVASLGVLLAGLVALTGAASAASPGAPLPLAEGSRLLAVESYSDQFYELTAGVHGVEYLGIRSTVVSNNLAAAFDPSSDRVYFITDAFAACSLSVMDLATESTSAIGVITHDGQQLVNCWGLTISVGPTPLVAVGSTIYEIDLDTATAQRPRPLACPGAGLAYDPTTQVTYVGTSGGELYVAHVGTEADDVACTSVGSYPALQHPSGQNFKGMAFDSDGTLYTLAHWPPRVFSLDPEGDTTSVVDHGDLRFDSEAQQLPVESLAVAFTGDGNYITSPPVSDHPELAQTGPGDSASSWISAGAGLAFALVVVGASCAVATVLRRSARGSVR